MAWEILVNVEVVVKGERVREWRAVHPTGRRTAPYRWATREAALRQANSLYPLSTSMEVKVVEVAAPPNITVGV